jgi:hypothetical protein
MPDELIVPSRPADELVEVFGQGLIYNDGTEPADEELEEFTSQPPVEIVHPPTEADLVAVVSGTIDEVLAYAGEHLDLVSALLDHERAGKNRVTLIEQLEALQEENQQ